MFQKCELDCPVVVNLLCGCQMSFVDDNGTVKQLIDCLSVVRRTVYSLLKVFEIIFDLLLQFFRKLP